MAHRPAPPPAGFRADIEGLRAVAVALVLAYHAGLPLLGGGFVGVDVFFVVSGFLITGLVVREITSTGTLDIAAFYARRARRLVPAALLVIVVTVVASAVLLPPLRVPDVMADGAAAALYASNLRFAAQATDYLQAELAPSPLLHFWSLGVEEQFYLFWPVLLLVSARLVGVARLGWIVAAVGGVSFALGVFVTDAAAPLAFFLLPTRAWELALGAAIAIGAPRLLGIGRPVAVASGLLGLGLIAAAGLVIDTSTPFPGTAALLPTIGAALVIAAGIRSPSTGAAAILALPGFRQLGRISYSVYLWHWPLVVLPTAALGAELPLPVRILLVALSIPLAAMSHRWVEEPLRHGRAIGTRPRVNLALAGGLAVAVAVASVALGSTRGLAPTSPSVALDDRQLDAAIASALPAATGTDRAPVSSAGGAASPTLGPSPSNDGEVLGAIRGKTLDGPVPADLVPSLGAARDDIPPIYGNGCHLSQQATAGPDCVFGDQAGGTTVVLFGDSHAAQWFPAFERLAKERGWRLVSLTKSACTSVDLTVWNANLKRAYTECDTWREAAIERIASLAPALVVVTNSRGYTLASTLGEAPVDEESWANGLTRTIERIEASSGAVVVIGDTPKAVSDPPACLSANLTSVLACTRSFEAATDQAHSASEFGAARGAGATVIDPTDLICPTDPCPVVLGRILVYRDSHHLTATFARSLAPYLARQLPLGAAP